MPAAVWWLTLRAPRRASTGAFHCLPSAPLCPAWRARPAAWTFGPSNPRSRYWPKRHFDQTQLSSACRPCMWMPRISERLHCYGTCCFCTAAQNNKGWAVVSGKQTFPKLISSFFLFCLFIQISHKFTGAVQTRYRIIYQSFWWR